MKLGRLQRWMQAVVVHQGDTHKALRSPAASALLAPSRIETVLLPSPALSAAERIAVYQEMYPLRMRDALSSDYPGLEHFLGDRFWDFVVAYTKAYPSRRYTLNRLGDHVPAFLARRRAFTPRAFLRDLARLELALTEAFDAAEAPVLQAKEFDAIPPGRLGKTRLRTIPALRLVTLEWNAEAYLDSLKGDMHNHPKPRRERSFVVVFRRNYRVYRLRVSPAAFSLLSDLAAGRLLGDVVLRSLARRPPRRATPADFSRWFKEWTTEGLFTLRPARARNMEA